MTWAYIGAAGVSVAGGLLGKPSESQSGMTKSQKQYVKQQNWWTRRRQATSIKDRGQQMLENQMLGGNALLDITQSNIRPRADLINQGFGTAASRLQGGLTASTNRLYGGEVDQSYMGPRDLTPDFSHLEDVKMPDFDISRIEEWMPPDEERKTQDYLLQYGEAPPPGMFSEKPDSKDTLANYGKKG